VTDSVRSYGDVFPLSPEAV